MFPTPVASYRTGEVLSGYVGHFRFMSVGLVGSIGKVYLTPNPFCPECIDGE